MKLVPKDTFTNMFPYMRDMNRFFNFEFDEDDNTFTQANWTPSVDIVEKKDHLLIAANIPGVDPNDIDISIENEYMIVKGERKSESKNEEDGYTRIERSYGSFYRRFNLPDNADADNVSASTKKGVLEIKVGKAKSSKLKKVTIDAK